jgi:uncharacterized membrane protein YphA (DoxX/SURF4 family)
MARRMQLLLVPMANPVIEHDAPPEDVGFSSRLDEIVHARREHFLELIRIYLGFALFVKGVQFLVDREFVADMLLQAGDLQIGTMFFSHYIPAAHIVGGTLMALGFATRFGALIQIPILAGAALLVHLPEGLFTRGQTLELDLLVLFLLVIFAIVGAGPLSLSRLLEDRAKRGQDAPE